MTQVEIVKNLCKERKISIHKLEMDCGFSNGYIAQLKKGTFPADRLQKIADYFDLTMDYFVGNEMTQGAGQVRPISRLADGAGKNRILQKLGEIMMTEVDGTWQLGGPPKMSQRAKDIMDIFDSLSESDQNTLYEYAKFLEQKHQSNP